MWVLVVIQLVWGSSNPTVNAEVYGKYHSMNECMMKRERLLVNMGRVDGFPKPNNQIVCIKAQRK